MSELEGKITLVTGASAGIGEAAAERLASADAIVIVGARTVGDESDPQPDTLANTVATIRSRGGTAYAHGLDVSKPDSRAEFMDWVLGKFGKVDVLVNNAGISGIGGRRTWEMTEKQFRLVYEIDVFAVRDLTTRVLPGMMEQGWGRIVNVSSTAADRSAPNPSGPPFLDYHRTSGTSAYCSARAGLNLFTRVLAAELHGTGICANTVAPVNSVITSNVRKAIDTGRVSEDRFTAPEDPEVMAEAILALCLCDPAVTTGLTTFSGQYLEEIGREVRGRDGGPFTAKITTQSVKY
ncbi:MAG: SDR family NAD(P)-dependent oxidoreductase [Novosphingobium sp.]|nr:SDR family NAD(P)-dependent oxidoreductase [Novosphingobium sp.]